MARSERDILAAHIADPTLTYTSGSALGEIVDDLLSITTSVNSVLVALENEGVIAKA